MYLTLKDHLTGHNFFPSLPNKSQEQWRLAPLDKYLQKSYALASQGPVPEALDQNDEHCLQWHNTHVTGHTLPSHVHLSVNDQGCELHVYEDVALHLYAHFTHSCYHNAKLDVVVHAGAKLELYTHITADANCFITLQIISKLHEDARLNQCLIEQISPSSAMIIKEELHLNPSSQMEGFYDLFDGEYLHHMLTADLHHHARMNLNALINANEHERMLFVTDIHHHSDDTHSAIRVKEVLRGHSQAVFDCTNRVNEGTQGCEVFQSSKALLLSEHAQIFAKPRLEIYCDELKASHGATVGALDQEALAYLCARGISHDKATAMLIEAFVNELLYEVNVQEHRQRLEEFHHV